MAWLDVSDHIAYLYVYCGPNLVQCLVPTCGPFGVDFEVILGIVLEVKMMLLLCVYEVLSTCSSARYGKKTVPSQPLLRKEKSSVAASGMEENKSKFQFVDWPGASGLLAGCCRLLSGLLLAGWLELMKK